MLRDLVNGKIHALTAAGLKTPPSAASLKTLRDTDLDWHG